MRDLFMQGLIPIITLLKCIVPAPVGLDLVYENASLRSEFAFTHS